MGTNDNNQCQSNQSSFNKGYKGCFESKQTKLRACVALGSLTLAPKARKRSIPTFARSAPSWLPEGRAGRTSQLKARFWQRDRWV